MTTNGDTADNETNCKVSGGSGSNDVGSDDPMNEQEDNSMPNSQEDNRDSTSRQPGPPKGSSQGKRVRSGRNSSAPMHLLTMRRKCGRHR